jgi:transcriptional regulator with XRE-family HTH domain
MDFKDVFKSRRQALNITLKDVADAVGVSVPTAQRWESGEIKNLRRDKIQKLAIVLDVPVEKLMGWTENNAHQNKPHEAPQGDENDQELYSLVARAKDIPTEDKKLMASMLDAVLAKYGKGKLKRE